MAEYRLEFSTNASQTVKELQSIIASVAKVEKVGGKIVFDLDTSRLSAGIDATFRKLNRQIENSQRVLNKLQIGGPGFQKVAENLGTRQGLRERGRAIAEPIQLRAQSKAFEEGSLVRLNKELQALQIEASQIKPNSQEWASFQQQIGRIQGELKKADQAAETIQLRENLGAFSPGSLDQLSARLKLLKIEANAISPSTERWKAVNAEIQKIEKGIQRISKKPLTAGQRAGAAGGAFLYGGGLGGGVGSALGGIAGGLAGGVPGAFTGAAIGQFADNIGAIASQMTEQATAVRRLQAGLASASTDLQDYAQASQEVERISSRLLIPIEDVTRKFTQLRASTVSLGIDTKTTGEIFEGTAAAVLQTGGSMEDVSGAMRAVVQVFSKGKLTAEELRGQLGERLPGAVVEFARVSGKSLQQIDKEFEQGEGSLDDFTKFLRSKKDDTSDYVDAMATSSEFAGARMQKAFERLRLNIGESLQPTGAIIQDFITRSINGFDRLIKKAIQLKLIQPGPNFLAQEALAGRDGGVAGVEKRLLEAGAAEEKLRQQAQSVGLGFLENLLPAIREAAANTKREEETLAIIRGLEKFTKERAKQVESEAQQAKKDQTAASYLDAIERREESLANAREQYEENIANIRRNAIKQAESLERKYQDSRVQAERDLARIRREIQGEQSTAGFIRRNISSLSTGESSSLIEAEQAAAEIVRNYTEEKITAEEASQDRQIQLAREVEDFKKTNAEAINQANTRYAKSIGEIQARYAKTVAKLIEEGSGNGAKKLAAAGKVIAAMIAKASAQRAFTAAAGTPIISRGGQYEIAGETYTEAELSVIVARQKMRYDPVQKAIGSALEAYVAADKEAMAGARDLGVKLGLTAAAQMPSIPSVSTADIDARVEASAAALSQQQSQVGRAGQELNVAKTATNLLSLYEQQTKEAQRLGEELDRQTEITLEQVQLIDQGMGPASAKRLMEAEKLFDAQRALLNSIKKGAMAKAQEAPSAEARKTIETEINKIFIEQFEVIKENEKAYNNLLASAQNARGLLKQAELIEEIRVLQMASDEVRRIYELVEEGYSSESAQKIFNLEKIKKNIEETRALIDSFVSQTSSDYKGFLKAVISGEDAADALKKFQEGLKDRVLTIVLDFAMAPVEKYLKESFEKVFMRKNIPGLGGLEKKPETELSKNTSEVTLSTNATKELTGATKELTGAIRGIASPISSGMPLETIPYSQRIDATSVSAPGAYFSTLPQVIDEQLTVAAGAAQTGLADINLAYGGSVNFLGQAAQEAGVQSKNFGQSLGKAVGAIGGAAGAVMGIAAGIGQISQGSTSGVLGGLGSIFMTLGGAIGGIGGMFGGGGGLSSAFGSSGPTFNPAAFAMPRLFANGGVVNGPTLGLVGEGRYNEAIVPLPDGRSIPVQMQGNQQSSRDLLANQRQQQASMPSISMSFQTSTINGVEYVSRDQLEQAMAATRRQAAADGASRGMTMTLDKLQQSPSTRSRLGIGGR